MATTILDFNGGTLQAGTDGQNFLSGLSYALVDVGGAVIDSQGYNIGIPQALTDAGGGGLTKNGSGTLTLTGANNYSGPTMVNAGKLIASTSSSTPGNVTVADTAGFGVIVQSAGGQYIASNVSLGTATGGSLDFNLGGFGNPSLSQAPLYVSSGTFTANGTITVNIADALPQVGEFPLVQYQPAGRSGNGKFVIGSLPSGVIANIVTNAGNNSIDLNITGVNQPRWDGQAGGTWDAGSDTNWVNIGTGLPTTYTDPSSVLFDDNALGTTTVNLTATVSPLSVMVANNSLSYTFVGTGKISGSTSLNKQGSGTLAILNTGGNAYTGPTVISGGTLAVTNLANGGLPSPIGASSSDPTNLVINSTLSYGGAPLAVDRGFTVASNNCTINTTGDLTLSGKVNALMNSSTGGSALNKTGLARLTFTTSGLNEFSRSYKPGIHTSQGTLVFDGSAGGQTNHCESEFWIGNTNGTGGSVILTNTTLISDSWLGMGRSSSLNTTSTFTLYNSTYQMGNCSLGYDNGVSGYQGTQILTLNGSSVFTNRGDLNLGESSGATVAIAVNGSSLLYSQNRGLFCMGNGNSGTMTVANNGKVIINNGWFSIGAAPNANASLVLKDSASLSVSSDFNVTDVGLNCTSVVTVADSAQVNANNIFVGKDTGVSATLNITNNAAVTSVNGLTMATFFDNTPRIPN
ncbi:MAG TPA: autotransporter-associated beta strand repeat-containing protein, partial [Candidatus Binatia bacterium]|nr:autotransporter-associated beta strand repeat-containing protein [Candidatus Binatia bacterium]